MPRLTADDWVNIRAEREAGISFGVLSEKYGVSKPAIVRKAKREGWGDGSDVADSIRRKVTEKVSGVTVGVTADPVKRAAAIDAEATRAAEVVSRHRRELEEHAAMFSVAEIKEDFEIGKSAKISVEMLAIRQKAERVAWGLDDPTLKIDLGRASDAELEALAKGKAV